MAILHQEIPDELHRQLKMEAASRSMTLKDLIVSVLKTTPIKSEITPIKSETVENS